MFKKLFCRHVWNFDNARKETNYFLIYSVSTSYYYDFKCSKCKKEIVLPVTQEEYNKKHNYLLEILAMENFVG